MVAYSYNKQKTKTSNITLERWMIDLYTQKQTCYVSLCTVMYYVASIQSIQSIVSKKKNCPAHIC